MEWNLFENKLKNGDYDELESVLIENNDDLSAKYQLGVVYSYQDSKVEKAIDIFKMLIEKKFNKQYIYIFLAEHTFDYKEKINVIKCGVSLFPECEMLNRLLLEVTTDCLEGERIYLHLSEGKCLVDYDNLKLAEFHYRDNNYKKTIDYLNKIKLEDQNEYAKNHIILLKNICYYFLNENVVLNEIRQFTIGNLKEEFGYLGFYLEIAHYINKKEYKKINELIIDLPYDIFTDTFFEVFVKNGRYPCYFDFDSFFKNVNDKILGLNEGEIVEKALNKLNTLIIVNMLQYNYDEIKINKKELKKYIKVLRNELDANKEDCLIKIYFDLLMRNKEEKEAITFIIQNYLYSLRYNNVIDFENYEFALPTIETIYSEIMSNNLRTLINKKVEDLIIVLVKLLYNNQEYNKICDIAEKYESKIDFCKNGTLFEIAYSYAEMDNDMKAERLYLKLLKKDKNNSSILNNLGIIYENRGDICKALDCLKKAESINHNEIHLNNIRRCNATLEEQQKNNEEVIEGKENIKKENYFIINKLEKFYEHKNKNGDIICSYNELPIFLNINAEKANEILNTFLRKKYLFKQIRHSYDTNKSVYKINHEVDIEIVNMKNNNKLINDIIRKFDNISLENFDLNGKVDKISAITDQEVCMILKRDYNELIIAYVMNNLKSVIALAGSMIETILIYIIKKKETNPGTGIYDLDLTGLLNRCQNKNHISSVPLNFINGIKKYRNFIHPGVEIRENKKNIKISNESADLLWDFVNWLIDYAI